MGSRRLWLATLAGIVLTAAPAVAQPAGRWHWLTTVATAFADQGALLVNTLTGWSARLAGLLDPAADRTPLGLADLDRGPVRALIAEAGFRPAAVMIAEPGPDLVLVLAPRADPPLVPDDGSPAATPAASVDPALGRTLHAAAAAGGRFTGQGFRLDRVLIHPGAPLTVTLQYRRAPQ